MHVDYTKLFATAGELVDFLMKSNEEQNRMLADLAGEKEKMNVAMSCKTSGRRTGD